MFDSKIENEIKNFKLDDITISMLMMTCGEHTQKIATMLLTLSKACGTERYALIARAIRMDCLTGLIPKRPALFLAGFLGDAGLEHVLKAQK